MTKGVSIYKFLVSKLRGHGLRRYGIIRNLNKKVQTRIKSNYSKVQGSTMYLGTDDPYNLSIYGVYEPSETNLVKQIVKKNQIVIDIGSSIGYYTLLCSRLVGSKGKVYAFEPSLKKFKILQKNIEVNDYKNVIAENIAVSNQNSEIDLNLRKIPSVSLDSYFKNFDRKINFIKMDIDSHEIYALDGMRAMLKNNDDIKMMIEYWPPGMQEAGIEPSSLIKRLEDFDFKIYDIPKSITSPVTAEYLLKTYPNKDNAYTNIFCSRN